MGGIPGTYGNSAMATGREAAQGPSIPSRPRLEREWPRRL